VLAKADPHVHSATAIAAAGLAIPSLMCGANEMAVRAATGIMLYVINSEKTVGKSI
jgi:hypothetical protein